MRDNFEVKSIDRAEGFAMIKDLDTGTLFKMTFIDEESITDTRNKLIDNISAEIDSDDLHKIMVKASRFLSHPVTISEYEVVVEDLVSDMKRIYDNIKTPNMFHHFIKNLDPQIYGKAQTCIPYILGLAKVLNKIAANKSFNYKIEISPEEV